MINHRRTDGVPIPHSGFTVRTGRQPSSAHGQALDGKLMSPNTGCRKFILHRISMSLQTTRKAIVLTSVTSSRARLPLYKPQTRATFEMSVHASESTGVSVL